MNWLKAQRTNIYVAVSALAVLMSIAYLVQPQGHIPPFDANRWRLAESHVEGYCAGVVAVQTGKADRAPEIAAQCRADNAAMPAEVDIRAAVPAFCEAISIGYGMSVQDCEDIVAMNKIWPLYDGGFTMTWNTTFPYPGDRILTQQPSSDRVEGRDDIEREEQER